MKKLMIAAAVAVCAMFANAAMINWAVEVGYSPDGDELGDVTGYHAFVFIDSVSAGTATTYSQASAVADVAAGRLDFFGNVAGDGVMIDYGAMGTSYNTLATDNTVGAYLVILDSATAADATKAYVTGVQNTTINGMGSSALMNWGDLSDMASPSAWKAVNTGADSDDSSDVPEPTSGLLMLLGVAGLALRRRRA